MKIEHRFFFSKTDFVSVHSKFTKIVTKTIVFKLYIKLAKIEVT